MAIRLVLAAGPYHAGETLADDCPGAVMGARQHVGIDAQREGRVAVAEVFSELLDGNAPGEHDAGVVVAELVDAFLAASDEPEAAAPVPDGFGDQASLDKSGLPDRLGVAAGLDVLVVGGPAEQDAARVRFSAWLFPGKAVRPRRVFLDVPSDSLDVPVR